MLVSLLPATASAAEGSTAQTPWDGTAIDTTWYNDTGSTFTINTAAQLAGLAKLVNEGNNFSGKTITLGADIDLGNKPWTPIGNSEKKFQGMFDGNNKTISNLSINKPNKSDVGLFGFTMGGEIKNFTLHNAKVKGYLDVGAVAGTPYTSKYTDISVTGLIQVDGFAYVGGALGKNAYVNITNVDVTGDMGSYVKAESANYRTYVGGLIGFMGEGVHTVSKCDVKIDVTGSTCDVGGILGILHYGNTLTDCTYEGSLTLTNPDADVGDEFGALVGTVHNNQGTTTISNCTAIVTRALSGGEDVTNTITPHGDFYNNVTGTGNGGTISIEADVNSKPITVTNYVASVAGTNYTSFSEAMTATGTAADKTLTLLTDLKDAKNISLPAGVTLNGAGHTISGDSAVYINAAGGTVQNVNFKNIHNKDNTRSALYAEELSGAATVTGCSFDTCDWDAIQVTPKTGATISITGNTFRHTGPQGPNTKRHIHVESPENTNFTITVTGNKFYDGEKLNETSLDVCRITDGATVDLTKNYFADPAVTSILDNSMKPKPALAVPFVAEDMTTEITPEVAIALDSYNRRYSATLEAAFDAAGDKPIILLKDLSDKTIPAGKTVTIKPEDKKLTNITNDGTLTVTGATDAGSLTSITNNGTLKITSGGPYDPAQITNNGTVAITGGTFTTQPPADWLSTGYIAKKQNDGSFKASIMNDTEAEGAGCVARYGGSTVYSRKYYKSLTEGFKEKASLHLIANVTENVTREGENKNIEIYCDAYTYTGNVSCSGNVVFYNGSATLEAVNASELRVGSDTYVMSAVLKGGTVGKVEVRKNAHLTIEGGTFTGTVALISGGTGSLIINGGYFNADPRAYLGANKVVIASDKDGYIYKVTDKADDIAVNTDVAAGETPNVTVENTAADPTSAEAAAKAINEHKTDVKGAEDLIPDAKTVANDSTVVTEDAVNKGKEALGENASITIVIQPYLEIKVADAEKTNSTITSITYDITAKYNVLATTDPNDMKEEGADKNTEPISEGNILQVSKPVTISIPLPSGFVDSTNDEVFVQHKTYEYKATVKEVADGSNTSFVAEFTNPHGFSPFTLSTESTAVAKVGEDSYTSFQDAVDAVEANGTVEVLKDNGSLSATVRKTITVKNATGIDDPPIRVTIDGKAQEIANGASQTFTYTAPSSGGSGATTYAITTNSPANGTVTATPKSVAKGATVTLTVAPAEGYQLDKLTVVDKDGKEIALTDKGNGKYTFTMPASKVEVTATFKQAPVTHVCPAEKYTDVDTTQWYHEGVDYVIANGMMNGTGTNIFEPNATTTRGMIVTILYRLEKEPAAGTSPFTDVDAGQWYAKAVAWAAANGVVNGTSPTIFNPNDPITREQMAAILYRYASFKGYDVTGKADLAGFTDAAQISDYAKDPMSWANQAGLIGGVSATTLQPQGSATRAQVATILMRFCENVAK